MQTQMKTNKTILLVAALVFVGFLAGSLYFVFALRQDNIALNHEYIEDSNSIQRSALQKQIQGDFELLKGVSIALTYMSESDEVFSDETVLNLLDKVNRTNYFLMMGLVGPSGMGNLVDMNGRVYTNVDITVQEAFSRALNGEDAISEIYYESRFGLYVNYYAVPVYVKGEVHGVLCAINSEEQLRSIMRVPVLNGQGDFALVNQNGLFISPPSGVENDVGVGKSAYNLITGGEAERKNLTALIQNGKSGELELTIDGVVHLVAVQPLGINNWMVMSVVPRGDINANYNQMALGMAIIIASASLLFLVLLAWQVHIMNKSNAELQYLAYTDLLTGLPNLDCFIKETNRIMAENPGKKFAVWSYDIKKFNAVNDLYGTDVGDQILRHTAKLLRQHNRDDAICCRVAADQFAGIRPYTGQTELSNWYHAAKEALLTPDVVSGNRMRVEGAIGFYCIGGSMEKMEVAEMLNCAVVARKEAKRASGHSMGIFTHRMGERLRREGELEASGPAALASGAITFHVQPKVGLQDGFRVVGGEVLARWKHPVYGWIPPENLFLCLSAPVLWWSWTVIFLSRRACGTTPVLRKTSRRRRCPSMYHGRGSSVRIL